MEKINKIIETFSYEELVNLKKQLKEGKLDNTIESKLERFKNSNKICPVCNSPVGEGGLSLTFGPNDFRKIAHFDGFDCLEYFLYKIKK
ncbi:MAG: hypothetical protein KKF89_05960 [Nanoarchaeota archaeon]|nr:hypothetical protein [Nanoarchaeota archaeon]MBU1855243.1 hypothetical protein [Nanoarchaeota archaeon]